MKCKELMIYDWIEDRNGFPMKISLIGETHSRAAVIDDAGVIASYWDFDDNSNEPYPVKLSGEILEKNGWIFNEEVMNYGVKCWSYCDGDVKLSLSLPDGDGKERMVILYERFLDSDSIVYDNAYVHILQHQLRCYGLTELADNMVM